MGLVAVVVLCLVIVWAMADVVRSYPSTFYPRFWDEAVYAIDATTPGVVFGKFTSDLHYAAAKPGYGLPLVGAVALFGERGLMYLSTVFWGLTVFLLGITVLRRFGAIAGLFAAALLVYSPLFGKYVAETGPTTLAAFCLVLLWVVYGKRRFWLTGAVIGYLALIDLKWMPPVAMSVLIVELLLERRRPWRERLVYLSGAAVVAAAFPAILTLIHRPFGDYLWHYVFNHARFVGPEPSAIFGYYLFRFGAAPAVVLSAAAWLFLRSGTCPSGPDKSAVRSLYYALVLSCAPIVFYSVFGPLKVLRFFAVPFPLFVVPITVGVVMAATWCGEKIHRIQLLPRWVAMSCPAVLMGAVILIGSDGPAKHLRVQSCFPEAIERLSKIATRNGNVSSYIWPVVFYGWRYTVKTYPFTLWGLASSDKWLAMDPILDRVTVENRLYLDPTGGKSPESFLVQQQNALRPSLDSLFSVPSDFFASDYFLSEQVVGGIPTLLRWQGYRESGANYMTIFRVNPSKQPD